MSMTHWIKERHRRLATRPRWVLQSSVAIFATLSTAMLGLVMGDVIPLGERSAEPVFGTSYWRFGGTLAALLALVISLSALTRRGRILGTLYYVRLLEATVEDRFYERAREKAATYADFRAVTRRCTLPLSGSVDLRTDTHDISAALESATNGDSAETGFTICPNLYLPVAFAIGYEWFAPNDSFVGELNQVGPDKPPEYEIDLNHCLIEYRKLATDASLPNTLDSLSHNFRLRLVNESSQAVNHPLVWLEPRLTTQVAAVATDRRIQPDIPIADIHYVFGSVFDTDPPTVAPVDVSSEGKAAKAAAGLALALRHIARRHPSAVIVLSGRLSKAVAFATGWTLASTLTPGLTDAEGRLWHNLVTLGYFEGRAGLRPVWVRGDQTDPAQLLGRSQRRLAGVYAATLVNLTAHPVVVRPDGDAASLEAPPSGSTARIVEKHLPAGNLTAAQGTSSVVRVTYASDIAGLPAPRAGTAYIVSRITAAASPERDDLYFPLDEVRDANGQIIGCHALGQFSS